MPHSFWRRLNPSKHTPLLITILSTFCITLVIILNTAGTSIGNWEDPGGSATSIWLQNLYILQVQIPADHDSFVDAWMGYLFLNTACVYPSGYYDPKSDNGPLCQYPQVAQTYLIRTNPNLSFDDPQVICSQRQDPSSRNIWTNLVCDITPETEKSPRRSVATGLTWILYLLGAFWSLMTIFILIPLVHKRLPSYADLATAVGAAMFFLCGSAVITAEARGAVAWVNMQGSFKVNDATLGSKNQYLCWMLVLGSMLGVVLLSWRKWDLRDAGVRFPRRSTSRTLDGGGENALREL